MGTFLWACCFALSLNTAPLPPEKDWPQFLGPTRNGVSTETGLLATWPKSGPPEVWKRDVGAGYGGPVVSGDWLVLFHRVDNEEMIEGFEAATGKPKWKHAYVTKYRDGYGKGDGPRATPLIADEKVYTLGAEGQLCCVKLTAGEKVWVRDLLADYKPRKGFFGVGTSPIFEDGRLLVNVGAKGAGIVAFNAADGKELWKATDQEASYSSPIAATVDGVRHVFFFTREGLVSLDPKDGTERFSLKWRSKINASVNAATPVLADDLLFLSASYGTGAILLKVHKDKVDEIWKSDEALSSHYDTSIVYDGHLYGIDGRQEEGARLRCVEFKTGKLLWSKEGFGCASLIRADGRVIALTESGDLVLIEPSTKEYKETARAPVLGNPCRAPLALANGRLYARDGKTLICWDLKKHDPPEGKRP
jgi:outer membrane protein assembly factor BamB